MDKIKELVKQRKSYLERIIKIQEEKLKQAPEGKIHITGTSKRPMFCFVENKKRIFVNEKQRYLIQPTCQKEYDLKVLEEARKELSELEKFQKNIPRKVVNLFIKICIQFGSSLSHQSGFPMMNL